MIPRQSLSVRQYLLQRSGPDAVSLKELKRVALLLYMRLPKLKIVPPPGMAAEWKVVRVELVQNSRINFRTESHCFLTRGDGEPGMLLRNTVAPESILTQCVSI